uniref:Uncharacterized protein n=1 Tax=Siphoviridae sp. ctdcr45 TaxID=2825580 RepID=A0A8S5QA67_9CAUD|nr:MAG TPA: hypothetical protein [Siphoviridae sp. ctdcr45]
MIEPIVIKVVDKVPIVVSGPPYVVCDNSDYAVVWQLDEEWAQFEHRTMQVNYKDGTYERVLFTGDSCTLPAIPVSGPVHVGLFAGDIHTTRPARLLAVRSATTDSGEERDPTPDGYAQAIKALDGKLDKDQGKENAGKALVVDKEGNAAPIDARSDWNQSDSTKPDFIKNRICYETDVPEATICEFECAVGSGTIEVQLSSAIVPGAAYQIIANGATADVIAGDYGIFPDSYSDGAYYGVFGYGSSATPPTAYFYPDDSVAAQTFSVKLIRPQHADVKQIEEKFISRGLVVTLRRASTSTSYQGPPYLADKTFEEILASVKNNGRITIFTYRYAALSQVGMLDEHTVVGGFVDEGALVSVYFWSLEDGSTGAALNFGKILTEEEYDNRLLPVPFPEDPNQNRGETLVPAVTWETVTENGTSRTVYGTEWRQVADVASFYRWGDFITYCDALTYHDNWKTISIQTSGGMDSALQNTLYAHKVVFPITSFGEIQYNPDQNVYLYIYFMDTTGKCFTYVCNAAGKSFSFNSASDPALVPHWTSPNTKELTEAAAEIKLNWYYNNSDFLPSAVAIVVEIPADATHVADIGTVEVGYIWIASTKWDVTKVSIPVENWKTESKSIRLVYSGPTNMIMVDGDAKRTVIDVFPYDTTGYSSLTSIVQGMSIKLAESGESFPAGTKVLISKYGCGND